MRAALLAWLGLAMVACAAKGVSPFYTKDLLIEPSPSLDGVWQEMIVDDVGNWKELGASWQIEGQQVEVRLNGAPLLLKVTPFEAGGEIFLDLVLFDDESTWPYHLWMEQTYYVHTVWKLHREGDKIALIPLNDSWIIGEIQEERMVMPYVGDEAFPLFTATSEQWVWFLQKFAGEPAAFQLDDFQTIWLKRMGDLPLKEEQAVEQGTDETPVQGLEPVVP